MTIPEPSFVLKDCNADEPTLIYLQSKYSCGEAPQRVVLSTGNKIHPKDWDNVKKRAIIAKKKSEYSDMNLWLDKMTTTFKSVIRNFIIDGITPTAGIVKIRIEELLNYKPQVTVSKVTFYQFIQKYIDECKAMKRVNTIKSYISTLNKLKEYGGYCNSQFDFDDITLEWRTGFIKYLQNLGASRNTEGKHIKNIKVFLNEATERNLNKNLAFRSRSFNRPTEEVKKPFLSETDIQKLLDINLSENRLFEVVRDFFVIGCYTGLRFSDLKELRKENIKEDTIEITTLKTGEEVIIPTHPIVKTLIAKYNGHFPKLPPNQVFNRYIKDLGKKAELNEPFTKSKTEGGITKTVTFKKWELLSSHIGRRSFITNCCLKGMNPSSIMLMSGHKNSRVFQSYVSMNKKQNADLLRNHEFFHAVIDPSAN